MRNSSLDRCGLERLLTEQLNNRESRLARFFSSKLGSMPGPITQTVNLPNGWNLRIKGKLGYDGLILFVIILNFRKNKDNLYWQLFLALEEYLERSDPSLSWTLTLLERERLLDYIQVQEYYSKQSLLSLLSWQFIYKQLELHLILVPPKSRGPVRRKIRRRGYRDKGTAGDLGRTARRLLILESTEYSNAVETIQDLNKEVTSLNQEILKTFLSQGSGLLNSDSIEIFHLRKESNMKLTEANVNVLRAKVAVNEENVAFLDKKIQGLEEQRDRLLQKIQNQKKLIETYEGRTCAESPSEKSET